MRALIILFFLSAVCILTYKFVHPEAALLLFGSVFMTAFLFAVIARAFGSAKLSMGFCDFIRGDEGGYSLSRLQAVSWAVIIISYQIAVIVLLLIRGNIMYYELVFSEPSLWILGLSLGSYISVKGITQDKIIKQPERFKKISNPKLLDIITGDNGLDFSKFQMLIWTILALLIFETKCYYHLDALETADGKTIPTLFNTQLDEFANPLEDDPKDVAQNNSKLPSVPYLPWSFVVLMGMSQGAYVGKKLIPSFKLDDLREVKEEQLKSQQQNLSVKLGLLQNISATSSKANLTALDKINSKNLEMEIKKVEERIRTLTNEITQINSYKK